MAQRPMLRARQARWQFHACPVAARPAKRRGCRSCRCRGARRAPSGGRRRSSSAGRVAMRTGTPTGCCCARSAVGHARGGHRPAGLCRLTKEPQKRRTQFLAEGRQGSRRNGGEGCHCAVTLGERSAGESLCSAVMRCPASQLPSEVVDGTSSEVLDVLDAGLRGEASGLETNAPFDGRRSDSMQTKPVHSLHICVRSRVVFGHSVV